MDKIIIKRDGLPPIAFTGEEIASSSNRSVSGGNSNRWTVVTLYRTKGGRYVAQVARRTIWEGESDRLSATSGTAPEVIEWLKEGEGHLGAVSQEAVEKVAKTDPAFASAWVENVE